MKYGVLQLRRRIGLLVLLALIVGSVVTLTGAAMASTVTLTFDSGGHDPNPAACNYHGPYDYIEDGARIGGVWLHEAAVFSLRSVNMHNVTRVYPHRSTLGTSMSLTSIGFRSSQLVKN